VLWPKSWPFNSEFQIVAALQESVENHGQYVKQPQVLLGISSCQWKREEHSSDISITAENGQNPG
jgi:hypothetical protein